jgi:hypothetical protein
MAPADTCNLDCACRSEVDFDQPQPPKASINRVVVTDAVGYQWEMRSGQAGLPGGSGCAAAGGVVLPAAGGRPFSEPQPGYTQQGAAPPAGAWPAGGCFRCSHLLPARASQDGAAASTISDLAVKPRVIHGCAGRGAGRC